MIKSRKNVILFSLITLGGSLLFWGSLILFDFKVPNLESQEPTKILPMLIYVLNGFIPSIAGLCLYIKQGEKSRLKSLLPKRENLKDTLLILGLFVLVFLTQTILYRIFVDTYDYKIILAQLGQLLPLIILGPLSEEIGWRGYLQDQFDTKYPIRVSVLIGMIWGLWHLPLFFMIGTTQQVNQMNFLTFLILVVLVSYIMTYFYIRNKGSLFIGVLIHYMYTVILTFYILGTRYSIVSDVVSIIPVAIVAVMIIFFQTKKKIV